MTREQRLALSIVFEGIEHYRDVLGWQVREAIVEPEVLDNYDWAVEVLDNWLEEDDQCQPTP